MAVAGDRGVQAGLQLGLEEIGLGPGVLGQVFLGGTGIGRTRWNFRPMPLRNFRTWLGRGATRLAERSAGMLRLVPGLMRAPGDLVHRAAAGSSGINVVANATPRSAPIWLWRSYSKSNTKAEIARKLTEYFAAGTRLAWVVDPKTETVRVHRTPREFVVLRVGDTLDGGDVIPGLLIPVKDLFDLEDD